MLLTWTVLRGFTLVRRFLADRLNLSVTKVQENLLAKVRPMLLKYPSSSKTHCAPDKAFIHEHLFSTRGLSK